MSNLATTSDDRALWTTPALKSGRVGDVTALNLPIVAVVVLAS